MKVHISESTMSMLHQHGGYLTSPRGQVEVKVSAVETCRLQRFWQ